jgi:NitT/TauT family transport system substrate-binding protein
VLVLTPEERQAYITSGAIRVPEWKEQRIDFQPYPFPSYTEVLVRELKKTSVEGDSQFLAQLDPAVAARELVDDRFVKRSLDRVGGLKTFGFPDQLTREEAIVR